MTPADCLRLLALASQFDPAVLPADPADQDTKAATWALAIYADVTYPAAQAAIIRHYRRTATRSIAVADLNDAAPTGTGALAAIEAATADWCPPPPDVDMHPALAADDTAALTVACPWCSAAPHEPCTVAVDTARAVPLTGRGPDVRSRRITHPSRRDAAAQRDAS
jgi:hypothetical protein